MYINLLFNVLSPKIPDYCIKREVITMKKMKSLNDVIKMRDEERRSEKENP